MLLKNKLDKFKSYIKSDNVLTKMEERYCYATDASNLKFDFKTPEVVVFVETIEEVQSVVRYANLHEIPIVSRGAGTNMVASCVSSFGGIVLNFSKMNKILQINATNMTATVQPGVILGDLKAEVDKLGLFYPPDPSNYKVSTIGGSIAQSSGGAQSFKYGTTKDYVLSLKVVTADGSLLTLGAQTSKEAVGYHLAQLIVGSEGTLGIVVEATLKLLPKPENRMLVIAYYNNLSDAVTSVTQILSSNVFPASVDFMDKNSISTVEAFSSSGLKTEYNFMLLIELDGCNDLLSKQADTVRTILGGTNACDVISLDTAEELELVWRARRSSFAATARLAPDVVSDDIIVPRDKIAEMVSKCYEIADKYSLKMCLIGHIGDGNIHPQIALNLDNELEFANYISARDEMYKYAIILGGTISAEHGIGLEKKDYLESAIGKDVLDYMKMIKKTFDPKNILNPGKIF